MDASESAVSRYTCTVKHAVAFARAGCKHPDCAAPTIDSSGSAVLPEPSTEPPDLSRPPDAMTALRHIEDRTRLLIARVSCGWQGDVLHVRAWACPDAVARHEGYERVRGRLTMAVASIVPYGTKTHVELDGYVLDTSVPSPSELILAPDHGVECPECGIVLFRPLEYEDGSPVWQQDEEKQCAECLTWSRLECDEYDGVWATRVHEGAPRVKRPYDEGGTNPIGLPVLPKPAPVVAAVVVEPEGPQPGDVVRWEEYGSRLSETREGLVVDERNALLPFRAGSVEVRRRAWDKEMECFGTRHERVAVERVVVVRKRGEL